MPKTKAYMLLLKDNAAQQLVLQALHVYCEINDG